MEPSNPIVVEDGWTDLDRVIAFDAQPLQPVSVVVEADVDGGSVEIGLALDGATTAPPEGTRVVVTAGVHGHCLVTLLPHPHCAERPFWLRPDADWPGDVPRGHVAPGPHRLALWARSRGGPARVTNVSVVEVAVVAQPGTNRLLLVPRA